MLQYFWRRKRCSHPSFANVSQFPVLILLFSDEQICDWCFNISLHKNINQFVLGSVTANKKRTTQFSAWKIHLKNYSIFHTPTNVLLSSVLRSRIRMWYPIGERMRLRKYDNLISIQSIFSVFGTCNTTTNEKFQQRILIRISWPFSFRV